MDGEDEASPLVQHCDVVQMCVKGVDQDDVIITACTVPSICPPPQSRPIKFFKEEFRHLADIELADEITTEPFRGDHIDIMIGMDLLRD